LLLSLAAQSQTKVMFGIEGGTNDAISWGFDMEQKLDLNYGFCLGLKQSHYKLTYDIQGLDINQNKVPIPIRETISYWTVPVGIHYYFNPRKSEGEKNLA
jgi:hypothetical protein